MSVTTPMRGSAKEDLRAVRERDLVLRHHAETSDDRRELLAREIERRAQEDTARNTEIARLESITETGTEPDEIADAMTRLVKLKAHAKARANLITEAQAAVDAKLAEEEQRRKEAERARQRAEIETARAELDRLARVYVDHAYRELELRTEIEALALKAGESISNIGEARKTLERGYYDRPREDRRRLILGYLLPSGAPATVAEVREAKPREVNRVEAFALAGIDLRGMDPLDRGGSIKTLLYNVLSRLGEFHGKTSDFIIKYQEEEYARLVAAMKAAGVTFSGAAIVGEPYEPDEEELARTVEALRAFAERKAAAS